MATPEKKEEPPKVKPLLELAKCSKATPPPNPEDYGPIITVTVGNWSSKREFHVYEGLLSHYSSYFKAAVKDCWGNSKTVELKDDNPEVFQAFFHWVYTGKLYFALDASGEVPLHFPLIYEIYIFGDARGALDLCNAAIDLLIQKMNQEWAFPQLHLSYIYENTLTGSALRKVLVDFAIDTFRFTDLVDPSQRAKEMVSYPHEFFAELVVAFMALEAEPIPSCVGYATPSGGKTLDWASFIKPLICSRYHDHPAPPA
ncbi:hypothetical protein J4E85_008814 [Alternaria conjuncta]|uniref:uncharacterized protein n=1 Tax=Alternaria conjuncta TaxID=181017 RepID=UPI00221EDECD|nr:uncharacterized protein J4E85_008814 [Alternaria conjuncta]KAI4921469.1 hypothetical protein J4E85_008814 [Alternaria conjuncta]